jgi:outer membrane protein TolC
VADGNPAHRPIFIRQTQPLFMRKLLPVSLFLGFVVLTASLVTPCLGQGSRGLVSFGKPSSRASDTLYLDANQDLGGQLLAFDDIYKIALINSPVLRYQDAVVNIQKAGYELTKKQILQNFSTSGNYSVGNQSLGNQTNNVQGGTTPGTVNTTSLQLSNGYRVGVDARISLYDLFGRKHQLRQAQTNLRAAEVQKDVINQQLRRELIVVYQDMMTAQQVLKIRLLDEQAALAAYRVAEVDLRRGQLTAEAMASTTSRYVEAKAVSEQVKGEFLKGVYVFEALVGVPIQKLRRN